MPASAAHPLLGGGPGGRPLESSGPAQGSDLLRITSTTACAKQAHHGVHASSWPQSDACAQRALSCTTGRACGADAPSHRHCGCSWPFAFRSKPCSDKKGRNILSRRHPRGSSEEKETSQDSPYGSFSQVPPAMTGMGFTPQSVTTPTLFSHGSAWVCLCPHVLTQPRWSTQHTGCPGSSSSWFQKCFAIEFQSSCAFAPGSHLPFIVFYTVGQGIVMVV